MSAALPKISQHLLLTKNQHISQRNIFFQNHIYYLTEYLYEICMQKIYRIPFIMELTSKFLHFLVLFQTFLWQLQQKSFQLASRKFQHEQPVPFENSVHLYVSYNVFGFEKDFLCNDVSILRRILNDYGDISYIFRISQYN